MVLISNVVSWLSDRISDFLCHAPAGTCYHSLSLHFSEMYLSPKLLQAELDPLPDKSYPFQIVLRSIYLMIS